MKIPISKIEEVTGYKVLKNFVSLGLDIAERTGLSEIKTDDEFVDISFWAVEFDKTDINTVYKNMYNTFNNCIDKQNIVVIEDSFLQFFKGNRGQLFAQADVFKKLTRFGTLALASSLNKSIEYKFILAKSSRAKLKIKMITGKPKESVANWLKEKLDIDLKGDNDASDGVVLAILGILEGLDFRANSVIAKENKPKKKRVKKGLKKISNEE